jgi:hypothetical protein
MFRFNIFLPDPQDAEQNHNIRIMIPPKNNIKFCKFEII